MENLTLHVTRWGEAGPRLVLVHGGTQGTASRADAQFAAQKPLADQGWRLIIPDRPGHGLSPDPGRPDDAEADGALIAELLEDGAHLVGHSFGGCVALAAAAKRPDAVRSLTLIEPAMQMAATDNPAVRRLGLQLLVTMFFSWSPAARAKRAVKLLGIPVEVTGRFTEEDYRRMGKSLARANIPSGEKLKTLLAAIKRAGIPLLVVTGGWSPAFEATADVVAALGGGRRLVIPSGHHFPQFLGDRLNPALAAFMTESEAERRG